MKCNSECPFYITDSGPRRDEIVYGGRSYYYYHKCRLGGTPMENKGECNVSDKRITKIKELIE